MNWKRSSQASTSCLLVRGRSFPSPQGKPGPRTSKRDLGGISKFHFYSKIAIEAMGFDLQLFTLAAHSLLYMMHSLRTLSTPSKLWVRGSESSLMDRSSPRCTWTKMSRPTLNTKYVIILDILMKFVCLKV